MFLVFTSREARALAMRVSAFDIAPVRRVWWIAHIFDGDVCLSGATLVAGYAILRARCL